MSAQTGYETGASSHLDRMGLTKRLCEHLEPLFDEAHIIHQAYGQDVILGGNGSMLARLKKLDVKKSDVICMTKFAPDYVLGAPGDLLFLLDAKVSITPMFFGAAIRGLQYESKIATLSHHTVGEVEREAWDNYVRRFPAQKVAICLASPYHPRLLVAEWATRLKALHRFEGDLNAEAGGSGTPHVNVDLGAMRTLSEFLHQECDVRVPEDSYKFVLEDIKKWGINKPPVVNWVVFNNVIVAMHHKCPWLKGRLPKNHKFFNSIVAKLNASGVEYELF